MARSKARNCRGREPKCAICGSRQPGTTEIYQYQDEVDTYIFSIDKAKEIAGDGRPAFAVNLESLRHLLGMNDFNEVHLGHVDPAKPGICTRRFGGLILLDGIHRAVRCFAEQRQFFVRELTYEESLACLVQQETAVKDTAAIVRRLRKALEYFPANAPVDAAIECTPEMLHRVAELLTPRERTQINLRAVPDQG
jgi:hypothetical protein